jgi:hypothetical protein
MKPLYLTLLPVACGPLPRPAEGTGTLFALKRHMQSASNPVSMPHASARSSILANAGAHHQTNCISTQLRSKSRPDSASWECRSGGRRPLPNPSRLPRCYPLPNPAPGSVWAWRCLSQRPAGAFHFLVNLDMWKAFQRR